MGLDYIRAQTGKPWRKRWDGGLDRLKTPTLLDLTMSEASRVVTAKLDPAARVKAGDKLIVQSAGDGLVVSDGLRSVGRIENPTAEMRYQIKGRRLTSHNNSRQLGALRDLPAQAFDVLAAVLFQEDYRVLRAALIPHVRVVELAKRVERTNSWRFLLRDAIWSVPGVRDVTADLQRAEASSWY